MKSDLRKATASLARENASADADVSEVLLFPADDELRVVQIYKNALKSDLYLEPFYFAHNLENGSPVRLALALIRPEEKGRLELPEGWGEWQEAEVIWPEEAMQNGTS